MGVARQRQNNVEDLNNLLRRFASGTTWRFSKARLATSEKPQCIITACRIDIELRASPATALRQSTLFPVAPSPATTIAAVLQLKNQQRFDLMAVAAAVLDRRRSAAGHVIADVRLVDGSVDPRAEAENTLASMPLTLFFPNDTSFVAFEEDVGRKPASIHVPQRQRQQWCRARDDSQALVVLAEGCR